MISLFMKSYTHGLKPPLLARLPCRVCICFDGRTFNCNDMSRVIKFKVFDKVSFAMSDEFHLFGEFTLLGAVHDWQREQRLKCDHGDSLGMLNDLIELQFTGLHDKNGKEIYEGDITRDDEAHYRVYWENEISGFDCERLEDGSNMKGFACYDRTILSDIIGDSVVIGNIHQNPELLTPKS